MTWTKKYLSYLQKRTWITRLWFLLSNQKTTTTTAERDCFCWLLFYGCVKRMKITCFNNCLLLFWITMHFFVCNFHQICGFLSCLDFCFYKCALLVINLFYFYFIQTATLLLHQLFLVVLFTKMKKVPCSWNFTDLIIYLT